MFAKNVYENRRAALIERMRTGIYGTSFEKGPEASGLVIFIGNTEAPQNYRGNDYRFRQESSWLYFFGLQDPKMAATIDLESGETVIYGNDVDIDDIIWMGPQPSVASRAALCGVGLTKPYAAFSEAVSKAVEAGRAIHFLPPSRYYNTLLLCELLGLPSATVRAVGAKAEGHKGASLELTKAVISLRLVKEACEIEALDAAGEIGFAMHSAARNAIRLGIVEQEIVGIMEGVTISKGWGTSFTTILSQHGETLHNHVHDKIIEPGKLLLVDAGAESNDNYISDHTRTYPTSGKFTTRQREIYDIVQKANDFALSAARPGVTYYSVHQDTMAVMLSGLRDLGLVKGDVAEMNAAGVAGLFQPHGLGHNIGIDVHDMEDLGENLVGYDPGQKRAPQLGLGSLRMARKLVPGHVVSDEPGIYFVPALIEQLKSEGFCKDFINYEALESYYDFGGIRLEDDVLITADGARLLGSKRLPITADDVEAAMAAALAR